MIKRQLKSQKQNFDLPLLVTVSVILLFGLVMVYNASSIQGLRDFNDSYYYIKQQLIWVVIGIASLIFFAKFDYKKFKFLALPLIFVSTLLLIAVFIPGFGISGGGAHRWLKLGPATIQPAEIIKLTSVIFLATVFSKKVRILPLLILIGIVGGVLAILQKDLGSGVVYVATLGALYFISGGPVWHFLVSLPVVILLLFILIFTSGYRSKRVLAFLDPFSDPQGFSYHISQVLIALGSGGLFGLGLGQSRQKFEYIPEVATDSIFAIFGEEFGFLGSFVLISFFVFLIMRGLKISYESSDNFGKILAGGLTSWLGIQIIVNLSSMVALLPLTGVPLPFISYGGSALVANLTAIGILLNISQRSNIS